MPFLQPDDKPLIQHPSGHPVEVITSYKPSGELKPLYFRISDDTEERFTFMLSKSHLHKDYNFIMTFGCKYIAYGRINSIVIIYDVTQCRWTVG
jgi:hypothetical protein